ncbi:MAG: SDR family NAD(P)-dependent oxidoreductase [Velocimicrobium sp.]
MYENKVILVTGGTGSWGRELVKQLLAKEPKEIRIFSRGEQKQVTMKREFHNSKLKFIIGDIRDLEAIQKASKSVDYIFHLAALKHVPICEEQPEEAVKTNILGIQNLIKASLVNHIEKFIYVSTDKAVAAQNLYGMTKAIGERLVIQANKSSKATKFICIRAGNVLGSNGSVVPFFMEQIKRDHRVTITHKEMTRFFITLPEAIQLLFQATEYSYGGEIFVMRMPAYKIIDVANVLIEDSNIKNVSIIEIGMFAGEKLHEVLISEHESKDTLCFDDKYFVILPSLSLPGLVNFYKEKGLKKVTFKSYSSSDVVLGKGEVKNLLVKGDFLAHK